MYVGLLVVLLAVLQDARELDVVKVARLDRCLTVHLIHLANTDISHHCHP